MVQHRHGLSDGYVSATHFLVPVSFMLNQGEYRVAVWCHEALTDLRTLVEQTCPLESSEIADFGAKLRIG